MKLQSSLILCLFCNTAAAADEKAKPAHPTFEVVALLTRKDWKSNLNRPFRAAALRMPYAYALDRNGGLSVFKVTPGGGVADEKAEPANDDVKEPFFDRDEWRMIRHPIATIDGAGDGEHLAAFDGALVCTQRGKIEVHALHDPAKPKRIGIFGDATAGSRFNAIVRNGTRAILLGTNSIQVFDMTTPTSPKLLAKLGTNRNLRCGCAVGDILYASANAPAGLAVFDLSKPGAITEIGFLESPHAAGWAVYPVSTNRFLVTLDGSSLFHSSSRSRGFFGGEQLDVSASGRVAVIDVSRQKAPKVVEVLQSCGGRNSAILRREGRTYLITAGFVHATTDKDHQLHECFKFFPHASTLDGASYQGDADGDHAALVGDRTVTVLRMAKK